MRWVAFFFLLMVSVVAELSYFPAGSNFNLQMGHHWQILLIIHAYLGDHCGPRQRFNVSVFQGHAGQWLLCVTANCRYNIPGVSKPACQYLVKAQRRKWQLSVSV